MAPPPVFHGGSLPPPSFENAAQYIQQFLSNVLSQRGPSSLPYSEDSKWLIRQHIVTLIGSYHGLQPKTAVYTHNDGRSVTLLQAEGTVPMLFQGITYNIPIVIWLTETYPRSAPLVYVNPTRDMIIKRPHSFVNPSSGVVSVPYLSNWVYPSSNLIDLSRDLCHHFARDPPLYSRRPQNPDPNPNPNPHSDFTSSSSSVSSRPAIPPRSYPQSPYGSSNGRISAETEDPSEVFKRNAINKLVESLNSDIWTLRKAREGELEDGFSAQAVLRQREELLSKGVREMQGEKEALEQQLQMVLMNTDIMEGWLRENEGKVGNMRNVDVAADAFECRDGLSKQMLECTSSDLAIEDVLYALDKAVQEGSIPFVQYLRNVRSLSREQFFHRATNSKVRAAQMGVQISGMAGRVSPHST